MSGWFIVTEVTGWLARVPVGFGEIINISEIETLVVHRRSAAKLVPLDNFVGNLRVETQPDDLLRFTGSIYVFCPKDVLETALLQALVWIAHIVLPHD